MIVNFLIVYLFLTSLDFFQVFTVGTLGFGISHVVIIAILMISIIQLLKGNFKITYQNQIVFRALLAFIISVYFSGFFNLSYLSQEYIVQYLKTSSHLIYLIIVAIIISSYKAEEKDFIRYFKFFLVFIMIVDIYGIYQLIARAFDLPLAWIEISNISYQSRVGDGNESISQLALRFENFYRLTSFFSEPSTASALNAFGLVGFLSFSVAKRDFVFKSIAIRYSIMVIMIITLLLCFSFTGISGIVVYFVSLLLFEKNIKINYKMLFLTLLFIICLVVIVDIVVYQLTDVNLLNLFWQRISTTFLGKDTENMIVGESYYDRSDLILGAIVERINNPLWADGLGMTYKSVTVGGYGYITSSTFTLLLEAGLFGFFTFNFFMIAMIYTMYTFKKQFSNDNVNKDKYFISTIFFYFSILHYFYNTFVSNQYISDSFWINISLILLFISNVIKNSERSNSITLINTKHKIRINLS
jgi:hypothetical protein